MPVLGFVKQRMAWLRPVEALGATSAAKSFFETRDVTSHDIRHVFLMTGAEANTGWLNGCVAVNEKGFIKSGPELTQQDLATAKWPLERDVRYGNIKRVASAVAVSFVHRVLAESLAVS